MTAKPLLPYFHVAIVVPDIPTAQGQLTEQLGVAWGPTLHLDSTAYRDAAGTDLELPTTMCYSVDDPHLELIEEVPGSLWVCNEFSNLHHIGVWSDDLEIDGARLGESGCPLELCGRAGDQAPVSFAYQRNALGVRIEIVSAGLREAMGALFRPDEG
jgi:Glyoxalase/Bleomycin resistance protein/Dioxygenase superfamily